MRSVLKCVAIALLSAFLPAAAMAADAKVSVYVSFVGTDALGKQLNDTLKEKLQQSADFQEVTAEENSSFVIYLTTIDPSTNTDGIQTVYSYVLAIANRQGLNSLLNSKVGICSVSVLQSCATHLFGDVGTTLEEIRNVLSHIPEYSP